MKNNFKFSRLSQPGSLKKNLDLSQALKGFDEKEKWLIVIPHDDDAVIGMGLMLLAGLEAKLEIHIGITTNGRMGYCSSEERETIIDIRRKETEKSFDSLGIKNENIHWLGFEDTQLTQNTGRWECKKDTPSAVHGFDGLANAYTALLRKIRPNRVFVNIGGDLHPDHKIVSQELLISLFHAGGDIWPELGKALPVPHVVEMAIYCDYETPPNLQIESDPESFSKKLFAIQCFKSQKQIESVVKNVRNGGPYEYLRELDFKFYTPSHYHPLFENQ